MYTGNLTCRDCGLTFTARWGSSRGADEYRCENDHIVLVDPHSGAVLIPSAPREVTLVQLRGRCPTCSSELATGLLPACPVCQNRDHEVATQEVVG